MGGAVAKAITVVVNGERRTLTVASRQTLAELLREDLRLTGTKVGCNRAECGSCTVLMDGRPVFACSVLAVETGGRSIETVEGLEGPGGLHPLQAAFIEHDAVQCGFCTPGQVLAAVALLSATPVPDESDIRRAMSGNLCRCGTYPRIAQAIRAVAGQVEAQ